MLIDLLFNIMVLFVGFAALIKSADYFVDEAANIGQKFGMSRLLIGITIVAVGTSLPEFFTSVISILFTDNYSDFIIGTVVGSNISNILLVFGTFLFFTGTFAIKKREYTNVLFMVGVTAALIAFVLLGFSSYAALLLVVAYIIYIIYIAKYQKNEIVQEEEEMIPDVDHSFQKSTIILLIALVGLFVGSRFVITSIENIGGLLSIPTAYLSLTTIAIASSLPEVAVTINTAKKKEYLLGIGNVLGSNTMNIAVVFGLSGMYGYYAITTELYIVSIIFLTLATIIFSASLLRGKFSKVEGYILLTMFALYLASFFIF